MSRLLPRPILHKSGLIALAFLAPLALGGEATGAQEQGPWVVVESAHFEVLTDAGAARGAEIATGLERFRAVFARLSPELELRSPAPTRILAFRDAESYAPYKAGREPAGGKILGQFLAHPDGNFITLDADPHRVGALAVIYHEYVHHLVVHNFPAVPLWFNEGLAEYYSTVAVEEAEADGGEVWVGLPIERHLEWLRKHSDFSLADVVTLDRRGLAEHDGDAAGELYAVSWLLVHKLLSEGGERLDQTADFLLELAAGEEPARAFEEAYGIRLTRLEDELRSYLQAGELPAAAISLEDLGAPEAVRVYAAHPAEVLSDLGDLLVRLGRLREAGDHYHRALEVDPSWAEAAAGLAHTRDLESRFGEAGLLYRDALAQGPVSAQTWLRYGRHLLLSGDAGARKKAREALAQAIDLEPNYAEALALFGVAHQGGEVDPAPGLRALEKARHLAPMRTELIVYQIRLHLSAGQIEPARALVEGELSLRGDAELVAKAKEEVERATLLRSAERAFADGDPEAGLELFDRAISATSDPALRETMESRLTKLQARYSKP